MRVVLADDHALVREGLRRILAESPVFQVVAEAADGKELGERLQKLSADVVVLDLSMPGGGVDLIRRLKAEHPRLPVLVLTMHEESQYALRALRAGAAGYLTKDAAADQLLFALTRVTRGGRYLSPRVAELLAMQFDADDETSPRHQRLSPREFQVFEALVAGASVGAIAQHLDLSVKTVSTHKAHVLQKIGVASVAELVRYALQHGLVGESR